MPINPYDLDVLFVNGVNTEIGGSVAESNKVWGNSFKQNCIRFEIIDTVPKFGWIKNLRLHRLVLGLYFFPGTLFRVFSSPIFEFSYKISAILAIRFIIEILIKKPKKIIFSHHCVFYLSLLSARKTRVFLIHDLMYVRARSKGASRKAQRFCFYIEINIYKLAKTLLVQSYQEHRVLRHFLDKRICLISCCELKLNATENRLQSKIALISDWRRPENMHGAVEFFSTTTRKAFAEPNSNINCFGFNSENLVKRLSTLDTLSNFYFVNRGVYDDLHSISEGYFLVPIYHGAGIKRKTIEAICAGRMVLGTKGAFIGLPFGMISRIVKRVDFQDDLHSLPDLPARAEFSKSIFYLSQLFKSIGTIDDLWR